MVYIYILQLEKGKFYVGKSIKYPSFNLDSHFKSNGPEWTKIYKPIKMIQIIPNCDDYQDKYTRMFMDKYTRMFMDKYGIDNVRGGSFVSVELEQSTINHLKQMNHETNDKCFNCGKSGDKECEEGIILCCQYCDKEIVDKKKCEFRNKDSESEDECEGVICVRECHYSNSCYALKHIRGYYFT